LPSIFIIMPLYLGGRLSVDTVYVLVNIVVNSVLYLSCLSIMFYVHFLSTVMANKRIYYKLTL